MPHFFNRNRPTSYITYTFTDKTTFSITVATSKVQANTSHRIYGKDVHTKPFQFDLSMDEFEALIKSLERVEEKVIDFEASDKDFLICKNLCSSDDGKQTSQGYDIKANSPELLMDFVNRLKNANHQINTHLSEKLLAKVQALELHYEDTCRAMRSAPKC